MSENMQAKVNLDEAEYFRYSDDMPVWDGWYEIDGECVAFKTKEGEIVYMSDLDLD
jgi:hypothetical protein